MAGVMNQQNSSTRNAAPLPNEGHQLQYPQSKSLPNLHPYYNQQEDQNFGTYADIVSNDQAQDLQYDNQMPPQADNNSHFTGLEPQY